MITKLKQLFSSVFGDNETPSSDWRLMPAKRLDAHRAMTEFLFSQGKSVPSWLIEELALTDNYLMMQFARTYGEFPGEVQGTHHFGYVRPRPLQLGCCALPNHKGVVPSE